VAGIAGLLLSYNPTLTPAQVKAAVMASCSKTGIDVSCGGTVSAHRALVAAGYVPPKQLTIALSGEGSGRVTSAPEGINCPGTCSAYFAPGTSVTLTAQPEFGFVFKSWSGACSGTKPSCTLTFNSDETLVTAQFVTKQVRLKVRVRGQGTVRVSGQKKACPTACSYPLQAGKTVKLTAKPANGWRFVKWIGLSPSRKQTVTIKVKAAKNVTAVFVNNPVKKKK
jgi:hypothetical protein